MNNTADHAAIVDPWHTARVGRQIPLKPLELLLRQPEQIRHLTTPIVWELESDRGRFENPLNGS